MTNDKLPAIIVGGKQFQIQYVPIKSLRPTEYNPRVHSREAIEKLKSSITKFEFCNPVICNSSPGREGVVIAGHMRIKAAQELDYSNVPVIFVWIDNLEKEKSLNLSLNAISGTWDFEMLKDFDLNLLEDSGFDMDELSSVWDGLLETENDDWYIEKELPKAQETDIKLGDLFQLGPHRIICQDSQNPDTVITLMGKEKASMLYTDPVFNLGINYGAGIGGKSNYGGEDVIDTRSREEYAQFLIRCIKNAMTACKQDCHYFVWSDEIYVGLIQQIYAYLSIESKRTCIWIKDNQNPTPKIAFNKITEFCSYGVTKKPYLNDSVKNFNEILNKEVGTGNRLHDDILDLLNIWLIKRLASSHYTHATEKPPTLHEKALLRCSKPGDIILDIFSGSGSIMVACDQLKRRAFMADITPAFVQLTINRYEKLSRNKAVKLN